MQSMRVKWGNPQPATDEVGPGWTMVVAVGTGGNYNCAPSDKHGDNVCMYYSPIHKYKFRSLAEALRFQEELDQTAAPSVRVAEAAAWKAINNNFERPAVWPSTSASSAMSHEDGDGAKNTARNLSGDERSGDGSAPSRRSGRTPAPCKRHEMPSGTKHLDKGSAISAAAVARGSSRHASAGSLAAPVGPAARPTNKAGGENDKGELFIKKLHRIIKDSTLNKGSVSFTPKGLAIQINYEESFKYNVLAVHFGGMKYNTFIRKLVEYGFTPVTGSASSSWYHIKFCRDQPHLLDYLKKQTNTAEEAAAEALLFSPSKYLTGIDAIETGRSAAQGGRQLTSAPSSIGGKVSYDPYDLTVPVWFPRKLYDIVSDTLSNSAICWAPDGRSFQRVDEAKLKGVLQKRMGGMKSEEFTLALTRWGFTKPAVDQSIWMNPLFRRNMPLLVSNIDLPVRSTFPVQLMKFLEGEKGRTCAHWVMNGTAFYIKNMSTFSTLVQKELGIKEEFQSYLTRFGFKAVMGYPNTWKHGRFLRDKPRLARSIFDDFVATPATRPPSNSRSMLPVPHPPPPSLPPPPSMPTTLPQNGVPRTEKEFLDHFPVNLMRLVSDPSNAKAILWRADGLAFTIVNKKVFCDWLLPQKAANIDYGRFIFELPRWNFMSLDHQGTPLTWYHPFFRRDRPDLSYQIQVLDHSRSPWAQPGRGLHGTAISQRREQSVVDENFPSTVRSLLSNGQCTHLLAWNSHGLSFTVKDKEGFEREMCGGKSFGGLGYQAFERKLMEWGFHLVAQDEDFDVWHHNYFQRDRPDLSTRIRQVVIPCDQLTPVSTSRAQGSGSVSTPVSIPPTLTAPGVGGVDTSDHAQEYPLTFMQKLRAVLDDESNHDVAYWDLEGIALTLEFGTERFQQEILGEVFGGLSYDMLTHELLSYGFDMIANDPGKSSRWQCELFQRRDPVNDDAELFDVRAEEALGLEDRFPHPEKASNEEEGKEEKAKSRRIRVVHPAAKALLQSSAGEPFPESIIRKKAKASGGPYKGQRSTAPASKLNSVKKGSSPTLPPPHPPPPPPPPPPPKPALTNKTRKIGAVSTPTQKSNSPKPLYITAKTPPTVATSNHLHSEAKKKISSPRSPKRSMKKAITSPISKSSPSIPRGITLRPSGKWQAQFYYKGQSRYAGVFDTVDEASIAYEVLRKELEMERSNIDAKDYDALFDAARKKAIEAARTMFATGNATAESEAKTDGAKRQEEERADEKQVNQMPVEKESPRRSSRIPVQASETTAKKMPPPPPPPPAPTASEKAARSNKNMEAEGRQQSVNNEAAKDHQSRAPAKSMRPLPPPSPKHRKSSVSVKGTLASATSTAGAEARGTNRSDSADANHVKHPARLCAVIGCPKFSQGQNGGMCQAHYLESLSGAELELYKSTEGEPSSGKEPEEEEEEEEEEKGSEEDSEEGEEAEDSMEGEKEELSFTWQCHLCGQKQDIEKKRCGNCRAWKGGTRDFETSPKNNSKKNSSNEKKARPEARSRDKTKASPSTNKGKIGSSGELRADLCSVEGCTKYRQKNNEGKCRKHYLESLSSGNSKPAKVKTSSPKSNGRDTDANVQPAVQILVTASGEMVTTPRPSSVSSSSSLRGQDVKMVDAVDSGWKRSLQQLVSYHRKNNGRNPPAGSALHKWLGRQALQYSRRKKRCYSELTKGHVILLEEKAGFYYGGKMEKRKLDEMKAGTSSSASPTTDRPKKKARRRR